MTHLFVGFRGLCLFHQVDDQVRVYLMDAAVAKSAKDNSQLHPHDTQLWLVHGTSDQVQPDGERQVGDLSIPYFNLSGNRQLRVLNGEAEPIQLGGDLPSLKAHDSRVKDLVVDGMKLSATFHIDRGSLSGFGEVVVSWIGAHLGKKMKEKVPFMMLLKFETSDDHIRISRPGVDFKFSPVIEQGPILLLLGAEPKPHQGGHSPSLIADHFKWLYELVDFKSPPANLAHPAAISQIVPNFGMLVLSGSSSFCPDGQFP